MMRGDEIALEPAVVDGMELQGESMMMNEAEFEVFYRKMSRPLWGYIYRLTGDPALSDDIFQRAFHRFLQTPLRSREEAQLRGLLYKTASSLVFEDWRKSRREQRLAEEVADRRPVVNEGIDMRRDMQKVFSELKPKERALLWLAHVMESSHIEIAETLDLEPKSVKVLLYRARKKLASLLSSRGLAPGVRS